MRQEDAERGGVDLVEARVVADELEPDLRLGAVEAQQPQSLAELLVVDRNQAAVAEREEVLRRVEAERRRDALLRDARRAEGLRRVLDQRQVECLELVERRRPPEQVHGHDRARTRRDPRADVLGVEVERLRIDVGEDGRRAAPGDRLGRGVERERRADHLVAGPDAEPVEHEHDRIRAVGDADRVGYAEVLGGLALERLHVRAEDERRARVEDVGERVLQLRDQRRVLRLDVNEWDPRHSAPVYWPFFSAGPSRRFR